MDIVQQKKLLRAEMLSARDELPRRDRNKQAERICQQIWEIVQERDAKIVHTYLNMGSEINVLPLIQRLLDAGITVVAPKTLKKQRLENRLVSNLADMEAGVFGTYHPRGKEIYSGPFHLIICPGLAFDQCGGRLGYGGGYYDAFLAEQKVSWKVGICYPNQLLDSIPLEAHDIRMDQVIW